MTNTPSKSNYLVEGHSSDISWWCKHPHKMNLSKTHLLHAWILPAVYLHDVLVRLHIVCQRKYHNPVKMPWRKFELYEKRNGQLYGLLSDFLKENSPLYLELQTKVWIVWKYLQRLRQKMHEPNLIYLLDHNLVVWIFIKYEVKYLNHSKLAVQGTALFLQ